MGEGGKVIPGMPNQSPHVWATLATPFETATPFSRVLEILQTSPAEHMPRSPCGAQCQQYRLGRDRY